MVYARVIVTLLLTAILAGCFGSETATEEIPPEPTATVCDMPLFSGVRGREVDVAVDPNDRSRVAAVAMVTPPSSQATPRPNDVALWSGLARSVDGGLTWETTILPYWPGSPEPHPAFVGAAAFGDGILSFAPDGDLYMSGIILTGLLQYNMVSLRFPGDSLDPTDITVFSRGGYAEEANMVPGVNPVAYNDKNDQVVDPDTGAWYVSWMWRSNNPNVRTVPVVAMSENGGRTWTGPVMIDGGLGAGITSDEGNLAPAPFILGDRVFVAWSKIEDRSVWVTSAPRGTLDFGAPMEIGSLGDASGGGPSALTLPMVNVATDPAGTRAWITAIVGGDGYDVALWTSTDGEIWEGPITPHDETANAQLIPTVAVGPDGRVASQFIDFSQDPDNRRYHAVMAVSDDNGTTWSRQVMSGVATDSANAGDSVQGHVGDYFGNAFTSAGLLGAWQDGRDGTADASYSEIYYCVL